MYKGAVYLPPKLSSCYAREEGDLSIEKHWWALQEGVLEMRQRGQVVLVGDFNCRLGERQGVGQSNVGVVGERHSLDEVYTLSRPPV